MDYTPRRRHRKSLRVPGWHYTPGGSHFITLCTYRRQCLFGEVATGRMYLNKWGRVVREEWLRSEEMRHDISLDAFVIMPNHLHAIVVVNRLTSRLHATWPGLSRKPRIRDTSIRIEWLRRRESQSVGSLIAGFTAAVTGRINRARRTPGSGIWRDDYRDRVLRSRRELEAARQYIRENPSHWYRDRHHPDRLQGAP